MTALRSRYEPAERDDPANAMLALFAQQVRALAGSGYGVQVRAIVDGIVQPDDAARSAPDHAAIIQAALERLASPHRPTDPPDPPPADPARAFALASVLSELRRHPRTQSNAAARAIITAELETAKTRRRS